MGGLCIAVAAKAEVNFGGYLRAGVGDVAEHKQRACYALNGTGLKYRLGNECDVYGEFLVAHSSTASGIQVRESLMLSDYVPDAGAGTGMKIAQLWVETRGWSFAPEATVWAGKERGRRGDVHLVDAFMVEMAGIGAGVKRIAIGPGLAGIATYVNDSGPTVRRLNFEYEDVPFPVFHTDTGEGVSATVPGTLSIYATIVKSRQRGWAVTALHRLDASADDLVKHRLWVQLAQGSGALNANAGELDRPLRGIDWRIVSSPSWQRGRWGGEAMVMVARETTNGQALLSWSSGARVAFAAASFLKLQAEAGTTRTRRVGEAAGVLNKVTLAPTLALTPDFWSRPELRFYVTKARWNKQALRNAAFNTRLDSTGTGTTWGTQFEIWF